MQNNNNNQTKPFSDYSSDSVVFASLMRDNENFAHRQDRSYVDDTYERPKIKDKTSDIMNNPNIPEAAKAMMIKAQQNMINGTPSNQLNINQNVPGFSETIPTPNPVQDQQYTPIRTQQVKQRVTQTPIQQQAYNESFNINAIGVQTPYDVPQSTPVQQQYTYAPYVPVQQEQYKPYEQIEQLKNELMSAINNNKTASRKPTGFMNAEILTFEDMSNPKPENLIPTASILDPIDVEWVEDEFMLINKLANAVNPNEIVDLLNTYIVYKRLKNCYVDIRGPKPIITRIK